VIAARRRSPPLAVAVGREIDPKLVGNRGRLVRFRCVATIQHPRLERLKALHVGVLLEQNDMRARHDRTLSLVRIDQSGEALEQCCLAGSVTADQRQSVALANVQIEAAEQPALALDQPKVFVGENWRRHCGRLEERSARLKPMNAVQRQHS
jgi:hypothetical protein